MGMNLLQYPGQLLSRLTGRTNPLGRCSRWGCLLPVGKGSEFGSGPVCIVCTHNLRPIEFPKHRGEPSCITPPDTGIESSCSPTAL